MAQKKTQSKPLFKEIEDAFWSVSQKMERNQLTGIKLSFTNGWQLSIMHPGAQRRLVHDQKPFPLKRVGRKGENKQLRSNPRAF